MTENVDIKIPISAYQGDGPYVFVCYAHADKDLVFPEIQWLHEQGINVWYDEGITPGEDWHEVLGKQLEGASHLLFFASPHSVKSKHCLNEIHFAQGRDTRILTIFIEQTPLSPGLELAIGTCQHIDIQNTGFRQKLYGAITGDMRLPKPSASISNTNLPDRPTITIQLAGQELEGGEKLFADGLTEDVGIELDRFEILKVLNPEDVNALFKLTVSVRFGEDRVRTSLILSHRDGKRIWAERFDESRTDELKAQEQLTRRIAATVALQVEEALGDLVKSGQKLFSQPFQLVCEAYANYGTAVQLADHETRRKCLEKTLEAIALDPSCVPAYSFLTTYYFLLALYRWDDPDEALQIAEDWQGRFMVHAGYSSSSLVSAGLLSWISKNYDSSLRDLREALKLNPNDVSTLGWLALVEASNGDTATAKAHINEAFLLNSQTKDENYLTLAMAAFLEDDGEAFEEAVEQAIRLSPSAPIRRALAIAYAAENKKQDMLERHRQHIMSTSPDFIASLLRGDNAPFRRPEHLEKLLSGLRLAGCDV